ncbi:hypothetical protein [Stenotrophomonas sp. ZAC14A_NAIMI4_1]|uniref:hypothetical protein n=1 Tax=Stenotrophomonas sp. ZAC14A_NAIMI4_1 TaxID=2072412 RepID=UPI000D5403F7|nr:hypothetical protein [Stenotrophomonas sp. ZAC14A_NAIMI4_1]AWH44721.1 hypothetical protein C1926_06635 [Stenotrophomonas sp. ZAC14A_NAIMI4_1]
MLLSLLLAVVPVTTTGAYDEMRLTDDGSMLYEYVRQPPATQAVHRRACALQGGSPSEGVSFLAGPGTTHGSGCSSAP